MVGDSAEEEIAFSRSWHFNDTSGPVTIICAELPDDQKGPLAEPSNPNYTALQAVADSDCPDGAARTYTGRKPSDDRAVQDSQRSRVPTILPGTLSLLVASCGTR